MRQLEVEVTRADGKLHMLKMTRGHLEQRLYKTKVCLVLIFCCFLIQLFQTQSMRPNKVINLSVFDDFIYFKPKAVEVKSKQVESVISKNPAVKKVYETLTKKANKQASEP